MMDFTLLFLFNLVETCFEIWFPLCFLNVYAMILRTRIFLVSYSRRSTLNVLVNYFIWETQVYGKWRVYKSLILRCGSEPSIL